MKTKNLVEKQLQKKTNSRLVETIIACKKNENWFEIAEMLSCPRRKRTNINLEEINEKVKEGENVLIPGKVLSQGELEKKIKIIALSFSEKAKEKLINKKIDIINILQEIKKNPEAKGIKILKK